VIRQLLVADLDAILAANKNAFDPDMTSKALHASAACKSGIQRVHIINGRIDESLLTEVFSNEGVGTLIYANEYQQIRRALKKDVRQILQLTKPAVANSELVKRTRATIENHLGDYYIFEIEQNTVARVALTSYTAQGKRGVAPEGRAGGQLRPGGLAQPPAGGRAGARPAAAAGGRRRVHDRHLAGVDAVSGLRRGGAVS